MDKFGCLSSDWLMTSYVSVWLSLLWLAGDILWISLAVSALIGWWHLMDQFGGVCLIGWWLLMDQFGCLCSVWLMTSYGWVWRCLLWLAEYPVASSHPLILHIIGWNVVISKKLQAEVSNRTRVQRTSRPAVKTSQTHAKAWWHARLFCFVFACWWKVWKFYIHSLDEASIKYFDKLFVLKSMFGLVAYLSACYQCAAVWQPASQS